MSVLYAGITILLSLTVFQLIVAEKVPESSHAVPLIGIRSFSLLWEGNREPGGK